jgi:pyridoxal phosphate enzyme (YggS family)
MALLSEKIRLLIREIAEIKNKPGAHDDVRIVAVTKNVEIARINETIANGITEIGENRIQDAEKKLGGVSPCFRHFIGHLQSNKVKDAVRLFDAIDSVDSYRIAELINVEAERSLKKMPVLVQVNISGEDSKYGISPNEAPHFMRKIYPLKWLEPQGLMAIMPFFEDAEENRMNFRAMRSLFEALKAKYDGFKRLSMGMSNDFRVAVEEGATEVRIGSYLYK